MVHKAKSTTHEAEPAAADVYAAAGVNIAAGNAFVQAIAPLAARTHSQLHAQQAQLLSGIGGFAAAVQLAARYQEPVLTAATDGVGTKLELARTHNALENIGQDVVAMCVNDLICAGTAPLFFLDYIACGRLDTAQLTAVVAGISGACTAAGCALIGGETAEMPSHYTGGQFDIAGFAVGIGERAALLTPAAVCAGDALIAIASSGAHSNGYSLIRQLLATNPQLAATPCDDATVLECLLAPTHLYPRAIQHLRAHINLHALAHITGGGISENLPRILPPGLEANFDWSARPLPQLFAILQNAAALPDDQMHRIFNCGIGMVAAVAAADSDRACRILAEAGETAWIAGHITPTR